MRRALLTVTAVTVACAVAIPALAKMKPTRDAKPVAGSFMRQKDVRDADFVVIPPEGNPAGVSNNDVRGFPRKGSHFSILSTGNVKAAFRRNKSEMTGTSNDGPTIRGTRDLVMLRTKFRVPKGKNCLFFDFKFLSEEFPEFVDSEFNDAFIAELDRSTWDSRRDRPLVDSPRNFARDSNGNPIRVNTVGNAAVKRKHARGTTYDAATRTLRASTRVDPGKHKLFLSIFDQGDAQYDSAVFFDGLRFRDRKNCRSGVVVAK
jgi:hypothetical protein